MDYVPVNIKDKMEPMSTQWDRGDALKALALETEYKLRRNTTFFLRFLDTELNNNFVNELSPYIESVQYQQPSTPFCFVQLKGVDVEKVHEALRKIPFGEGEILAERQTTQLEEDDAANPEDIDPYTLYIGNLSATITVKTVKEHFPNAHRIEIRYVQRMDDTRVAFIFYKNVEDAMEGYRKTFNLFIESRCLIVKFRRRKHNFDAPDELADCSSNDCMNVSSESTEFEDEKETITEEPIGQYDDVDKLFRLNDGLAAIEKDKEMEKEEDNNGGNADGAGSSQSTKNNEQQNKQTFGTASTSNKMNFYRESSLDDLFDILNAEDDDAK